MTGPYANGWRCIPLMVVVALLGACGGVQFERASGAAEYRALPRQSKVSVAENFEDVPQPAVLLGKLRLPPAEKAASQAVAEQKFAIAARRRGCNWVVGMDAHASQVVKKKRTRVRDGSGKAKVKVVETTAVHNAWTALCVRGADAPKDAPKAAAPAGEPAAAPPPKRKPPPQTPEERLAALKAAAEVAEKAAADARVQSRRDREAAGKAEKAAVAAERALARLRARRPRKR